MDNVQAVEMVSISEAAEISGLTESFIRLLARNNRIPARRVGKRLFLVDATALTSEAYLKNPGSRRRCYRRGNLETSKKEL